MIEASELKRAIASIKANTGLNPKLSDDAYPFKCKFINRTPDPGICYIISIRK